MKLEWDEAKNRSNFEKHGFDFSDADIVLTGPCVTWVDERFEYGEERLIALGPLRGRLVVIAHVARGDTVRIISMRRANSRERAAYKERLGKDRPHDG